MRWKWYHYCIFFGKFSKFVSRCGCWSFSTSDIILVCFMKHSMYNTKSSPVFPLCSSSSVIWSQYNEIICAEWRSTIATRDYSHSHGDQKASVCGDHCYDLLHTYLCYKSSWLLNSCYCSLAEVINVLALEVVFVTNFS
jgi:hypothetical protein